MKMWNGVVFVLGVAACGGGDGGGAVDARVDAIIVVPTDAREDTLACVPSGAPGPVIVDGPSGDPGPIEVTVLVHEPSGLVASRSAVLGSDATVTVMVPSCGMVSVFQDEDAKRGTRVTTWTGVQPGDHLEHPQRRAPTVERTVNVTVPVLAGATNHQLTAVCIDGGTEVKFDVEPGVVEMTPQCPVGAAALVVSATATSPTGKSLAFVADVAVPATGTTAVTLPAYVAAQAMTATVTGAAEFTGGNGFFSTLVTPGANRTVLVDFAQGTLAGANGVFPPTGSLTGASGLADLVLFTPNSAAVSKTAQLVRGFAAMPATLTVTGSELLPTPSGTVDSAARPTLSWGTATAADADALLVDIDYSAGEAGVIRWSIIAPARPGTLQFPELPADLLPTGHAELTNLELLESTAFAGYAEARAHLGEVFRVPPGPGGQFRISGTRP